MQKLGSALAALGMATAAYAQPDPTLFAQSPEVQALVATMAREIKPTEEMLYRPLLKQQPYEVAVEYWVRPKQAAAHLTEGEFASVIAGAGTLVTGGTLTEAKHWYGDTNGGKIVGGTTRALKAGDVFVVPEGTPHWFGITGDRLVLITMKLPRTTTGAAK